MADDTFVSTQLATLDRNIQDLRQSVEVKLSANISRNEHVAEVKRIDAERKALEARHEALEREAATEHSALRAMLKEYQEAQAKERERATADRRADRKAYIGFIIASIGVVAPLVNLVLRFIVP